MFSYLCSYFWSPCQLFLCWFLTPACSLTFIDLFLVGNKGALGQNGTRRYSTGPLSVTRSANNFISTKANGSLRAGNLTEVVHYLVSK